MKLWQKDYRVDKRISDFCTGDDYLLDRHLLKYDVRASIVHASMLKKMGILKGTEFIKLKKCLREIEKLNMLGKFKITKSDEDVHTAIETYLTNKLGDIGKKIHTARSRNDQVIAALRLYSRDKLFEVRKSILALSRKLLKVARKNSLTPIAGYTHTRKAMPSSVGLWAGAFREALLDDLVLWRAVMALNNQCPLGAAAGYGVALDIDRKYTSKKLGFGKVQNNTLYVQNSRGKFEAIILSFLVAVMSDLNKMAEDIIFFSSDELSYFVLPKKFCTGSSLMPNKKNPDPLEIIRGNYNVLLSYELRTKCLIANLISGYNRDFQLTKRPLIEGFDITISCLNMMSLIISGIEIDKAKCEKSLTSEMFATDKCMRLVKDGIPFRDAYRQVAKDIEHPKKLIRGEVEYIS